MEAMSSPTLGLGVRSGGHSPSPPEGLSSSPRAGGPRAREFNVNPQPSLPPCHRGSLERVHPTLSHPESPVVSSGALCMVLGGAQAWSSSSL